jgi:hypothetical protein
VEETMYTAPPAASQILVTVRSEAFKETVSVDLLTAKHALEVLVDSAV